MIPRSLWRPQKLATRAQPLPPETSYAPFVLILNLFEARREPAVLGSGSMGGVRWASRLAGFGLRVPFVSSFRKGE